MIFVVKWNIQYDTETSIPSLKKNTKCALSSKGMIPAEFQQKSQLWGKD